MKINELADKWVEYHRLYVKLSSISAYELLIITHVKPFFGEFSIITEKDVQSFVNLKLKSISKGTIKSIIIVLKMILKFGKKRGLYLEDTNWDIIYSTENNSKNKLEVLNKENVNKLTNYLKDNFSFPNLAIMIAIQTGMRIGEVCAMQWQDIDLDNKVFCVEKTRQRIYFYDEEKHIRRTMVITDSTKSSNSNRDIPISKPLMEIIKPLMKIVNTEFYIATNTEKGTEPRTFRNYYISVLKKLNIPILKFHGLRHTFATTCLSKGIDIKTTSVLLGHANITTTMNIYMHPGIEEKRTAINKLYNK